MVGVASVAATVSLIEDVILHEDEKREFELISNEAYKKQWLSARWLAFQCKQLIKKEKVNEIFKNELGRPYLKESSLHVSLSHNENMATVMFSTMPCGIDVELFREKITRIQKKFLTEDEAKKYSDDIKALTLIWSSKESIYKMLGIPGLIFKEQINCHFESIQPKGSFIASVRLDVNTYKNIPVYYQVFEKELITYCQSGNSI